MVEVLRKATQVERNRVGSVSDVQRRPWSEEVYRKSYKDILSPVGAHGGQNIGHGRGVSYREVDVH